jgi:hypothetical protein
MGRGWRLLLVLLATGLITWAAFAVRMRARAACELLDGFLPGADLLVRAALVLVVVLAGWGGLEHARRPGLAFALAMLLALGGAWLMLASTTPPPGYPNGAPACVGNLPGWWPGWLPA